MIPESSDDDYKKRQEAIRNYIARAAKGSNSEILQSQAKKNNRDNPEINKNIEMSRMLVDEGLKEYQEGDLNFKEFVDDLHRALSAIAGGKAQKGGDMADTAFPEANKKDQIKGET